MDKDIDNKIQQGIKDSANKSQFGLTQIPNHTHNGKDSNKITVVDLPTGTPIRLGLGGMISFSVGGRPIGDKNEIDQTAITAGSDQAGTVGITTNNLQLNLINQPQSNNDGVTSTASLFGGSASYTSLTGVATTGGSGSGCTVNTTASGGVITSIVINGAGSNYKVGDVLTITGGDGTAHFTVNTVSRILGTLPVSYVMAWRPPVFGNNTSTTVSVSSGGNTVTTTGYNFPVNSLVNALINIYDSSGKFIETQVIASNTGTVITIVGTWLHSTTNGTLLIFQPVYLGISEYPWQRVYTREGSAGGLRFGTGPTAGGQNALFYTSDDGLHLFFRASNGTVTAFV